MTLVGCYPYGLIPVPYSSTPTFDCSLGNMFSMTLTGLITSMSIINSTPGCFYVFIFTQDATGLHAIAWPSNCKGVVSASLPTANSTLVQLVVYDGTNYWGVALGQSGLL